MKKFVYAFLLCSTALFGGELSLKERLRKAKSGDYIVTEANKMVTVLAIRSPSPHSIILEEISAPTLHLKTYPSSWSDWVRSKAPGHTSWSMMEVDLDSGQILECYSFSRSAWIQPSRQESIFSTLLHLSLSPVEKERRKKIGPPPMPGEEDHRQLWKPTLVYEGKKVEQADFDVFETAWPNDGSELARQTVSLYFDKEKRFPLPFWVQVETSHATAAIRTIDCGKNLPSLHRSLPRRVPEFVGSPQKTKNGIRLSLKSPKYYREFELFVVDVTTKEKQIFPITHSLVQGEEEFLVLEIDQEQLKQVLEPEHRYTWLLVPAGHHDLYTESLKPFLWSDKN